MEKIHEIPFMGGFSLSVPDSILKQIKDRSKEDLPEDDRIEIKYQNETYYFKHKEVEGSIWQFLYFEFLKKKFEASLKIQRIKRAKERRVPLIDLEKLAMVQFPDGKLMCSKCLIESREFNFEEIIKNKDNVLIYHDTAVPFNLICEQCGTVTVKHKEEDI